MRSGDGDGDGVGIGGGVVGMVGMVGGGVVWWCSVFNGVFGFTM